MHRALIKVSLIAIVLLAIGVAVSRGQANLLTSAATYQPPVVAESTAVDPLPAHSKRVVLVVVSGLSNEFWTATAMPGLQRLQEAGARTVAISTPPTYRLPAWASLISGAPPPFTDAPLFDVSDTATHQLTSDTIFDAAAEQSLTTALAGNNRWVDIIPAGMVSHTAFFGGFPADADAQVMAEVARWVDDPSISLIVLQLSQIDDAAQKGIESEAYQTALAKVDERLLQLQKMLDLDTTTLIITADHGHLAQGGYGGDDISVVSLPLVMVGQGIIPGEYSPVRQTDIAPTIAALLGTRLPAANRGRPLLEMLTVSVPERAVIGKILAHQRISLVEQVAAALSEPFNPPENISKLDDFLAIENYTGAAQLAELLVAEADNSLDAIIKMHRNFARRLRFALGGTILAAIILLALWQRTAVWFETIFSAAVTVGGYHILYRLLKEPYSLSAVDNLLRFRLEIAWLVAAALAAGAIMLLVLLLLQGYSGWQQTLQAGYELILWAAIGFGVTVVWGYGQIGAKITTIFPDVALFFHYLTGLWQSQWVIGIGLFVPFLVLLLSIGVRSLGQAIRRPPQ